MSVRMKIKADDQNEVRDVASFQDPARNQLTPVVQFPAEIALAVVEALAAIVRKSHASQTATTADCDGIVRAQSFEEGEVYMLASPFDEYFADRYLMDLYDVEDRNICSRMHLHTGLRFVRMMTGPKTVIRVSSLSPFNVVLIEGIAPFVPEAFEDTLPETSEHVSCTRYNLIVPENSWVDMQIPRGVSHQFNAIGPHAVIDSVHPEESIETFREKMSGYKMMAQTIFLAKERPSAETCASLPANAHAVG